MTKHHHRLAIYGTRGTFHQSMKDLLINSDGRCTNEIKAFVPAANDKGDSLIAFIESIVLGKVLT